VLEVLDPLLGRGGIDVGERALQGFEPLDLTGGQGLVVDRPGGQLVRVDPPGFALVRLAGAGGGEDQHDCDRGASHRRKK
jgi:hypothetical protein